MASPKRHACARNAANARERLGTVADAGPGIPLWLEYDERSGSVAKKAVRYIAGIAVVAALAVMISLIPLPHYASSSLLFFMAGASVTFIYPAIALKAGLFR